MNKDKLTKTQLEILKELRDNPDARIIQPRYGLPYLHFYDTRDPRNYERLSSNNWETIKPWLQQVEHGPTIGSGCNYKLIPGAELTIEWRDMYLAKIAVGRRKQSEE